MSYKQDQPEQPSEEVEHRFLTLGDLRKAPMSESNGGTAADLAIEKGQHDIADVISGVTTKLNQRKMQVEVKVDYFQDDIHNFAANPKDFICTQKNKGLTEERIYSSLLNTAIALENLEVVKNIVGENRGSILTYTDSTGYSPISRTLHSGNQEILAQIQKYIANNSATTIDEQDVGHILTILEFPQFKDLDAKQTFTKYLQPLYADVEPFEDFLTLLGEQDE